MSKPERIPLDISEIEKKLKDSLGSNMLSSEVKIHVEGRSRKENKSLWMRIERAALHQGVQEIINIDYPHLGVVSAIDEGEEIELIYHFYIFFGSPGAETGINFIVSLPKSDPVIPTISDLIPGAVYTEREKQEMIGIVVAGIPDKRRLFLPADFPEDVYPWRKDEKGIPDSMVKNLWASGRPSDRPNPPVVPKKKKADKDDGEKKPGAEEKPGEDKRAVPGDEIPAGEDK